MSVDNINHPPHYTKHPSGAECIDFTGHMDFLLGNAFKYVWRYEYKNGTEDLEKAIWYMDTYLRQPRVGWLTKLRRIFNDDPPVHVLDYARDSTLLNIYNSWLYDDRRLLRLVKEELEAMVKGRRT